jgi:glycosyltransferase involved in cell wall biosynthesis
MKDNMSTKTPVGINKIWAQKPSHQISVLLPTRGRTDMLKRSLLSLLDLAHDPAEIEIMLAFDNDDKESLEWCQQYVFPELEDRGVDATVIEFTPLGYLKLHEYLNALAGLANGQWLMFWNDDAVMQTKDWDQRITEHNEKFLCLRMPTHNEHPYAIFPIVPRDWYYLLGHLSNHQLTDATISQISYILGIMKNIDVKVLHDRFDITGNNQDATFKNRPMLEGRPDDPRDFNHVTFRNKRMNDANKIAWYLKRIGQPSDWYEQVMLGKQDPWEYMIGKEQDPNNQVSIYA